MARLRATVMVSCLALAGCGELFGDLVQQPPAAVVSMLYNMPAQANLMDLPSRFPNTVMTIGTNDQGVVWTYRLGGKDACRFTAHVKEETSISAVVWTETEDISTDGLGYLCDMVGIVGDESVSATLDGRPADRAEIEQKLARALVDNIGSVQKTLGEQMEQMAPPKTECYEESTAEQRDACRRREFERDHARLQSQ